MSAPRSYSRRLRTRSNATDVKQESDAPDSDTSSAAGGDDIESQAKSLLEGVQTMKRQLQALRQKNKELTEELESLRHKPPQTRTKGRPNSVAVNFRVKDLEAQVERLKKARKKDKRKIDAFHAKELKAEAEDLEDVGEDGVADDISYAMKKLLRKFSDLMLVTTLADDGEECPVCLEQMELKKCSSFECQHLVCNTCLPQISRGADETVKCPQCRQYCPRDNMELVHFTETDRWDALTDIAKAWGALDRRGEAETSEEEAEEAFVNDHDTSSPTSEASSHHADNEDVDEDEDKAEETAKDAQEERDASETQVSESGEAPATTPPPPETRSYQQSPTIAKRQRLEQLAEERSRKKTRR